MRFSRRLICELIMTNNLIYAVSRMTETRMSRDIDAAERQKKKNRSRTFAIHYFAPFYCIQRIRFDLRLLPRIAFIVIRSQLPGPPGRKLRDSKNSGMKFVFDPPVAPVAFRCGIKKASLFRVSRQ